MPKDAIEMQYPVKGNHLILILLEACSAGGIHAWYLKLGQKFMTEEVTGPRGEPTIAACKMDAASICLLNVCVFTCRLLSLGERS